MFGMNAPSITLAQIAAAVTWVVTQLVVMGVMNDDTAQLVVSVAVTFFTGAWTIADALIRSNRAKAAGVALGAGASTDAIVTGKSPTVS